MSVSAFPVVYLCRGVGLVWNNVDELLADGTCNVLEVDVSVCP